MSRNTEEAILDAIATEEAVIEGMGLIVRYKLDDRANVIIHSLIRKAALEKKLEQMRASR